MQAIHRVFPGAREDKSLCVAGGNQGSSSLHFLHCSKVRIRENFFLGKERNAAWRGSAALQCWLFALGVLLKLVVICLVLG